MIVIPAIDLKDGKVVRLTQGRYEEFTVYSHDPVEMANTWKKQGATRLHLIDLDGAFAGEARNTPVVRQVIEGVDLPVQFGGGLRNREDIDAILSMGAKWAILGTRAYEDLDFIKSVITEFGEQIIVSIDVKFKKVVAHGWTQVTGLEDVEVIKKLQDAGVSSFIYTDISRDGTLAGANIKAIRELLEKTGASIFYSGGISSMEDVKEIKTLEGLGLAGVIIGKALYEDRIHLIQIKKMLEGNP